jgi:hypothetical protein
VPGRDLLGQIAAKLAISAGCSAVNAARSATAAGAAVARAGNTSSSSSPKWRGAERVRKPIASIASSTSVMPPTPEARRSPAPSRPSRRSSCRR